MMVSRPQPPAPIGFTVIGGFLGAGKTTLLNHVLRHAGGSRIAVLVNDFGAVNIDAELIAWRDGETVALANGCICCGLSGGLVEVLPPLLARVPPLDHVVVEASGVADPRAVAAYATLPGFRPDGVLVVVDAETIRTHAADARIGTQVMGQLSAADLLVVTKGDLVGAREVADVRAWLDDRVGPTPVVEAVDGRVPAEVVLGPVASAGRGAGTPWTVDPHHTDAYETGLYQSQGPLDLAPLEALLVDRPTGVVRVKGVVRLVESPATRTVVQAVGRRHRLHREGAWTSPDPHSRIVAIALAGTLSPFAAAARAAGLVPE